MSERKTGWYWVKVSKDRKWHCGYWDQEFQVWDVPTFVFRQKPDDMAEIGDRIPTPDEPWQCVPNKYTKEIRAAFNESENQFEGPKATYKRILSSAPKP